MIGNPLILGIDPGTSTGLALVDIREHKIIMQRTVNKAVVLEFIGTLLDDYPNGAIHGAVCQTPIFESGKTPRWNPSPVSLAKNAAISHEIIGYLKGRGINVQVRHPQRGTGMKMDENMFARVYGGEVKRDKNGKPVVWLDGKRVSEHARDAVNLAMSWRKDGG